MFAKPRTNVTFFTLHSGNNFGPKRSWLLSGHLFSGSRENWMSYLVDLLENAKFYLGSSFSWGVAYRWHCCIVSSVCLESRWDCSKFHPISHFSDRAQHPFSSAVVYLGSKAPPVERKRRYNAAECIKVGCSQAGDDASTFSGKYHQVIVWRLSFWCFSLSLLVRSSTALRLISLKSVSVCCSCSWAKPVYFN